MEVIMPVVQVTEFARVHASETIPVAPAVQVEVVQAVAVLYLRLAHTMVAVVVSPEVPGPVHIPLALAVVSPGGQVPVDRFQSLM